MCEVTILPGHNIWLIARTRRDAPTEEEVVETTAAFLVRVLGGASEFGSRSAFETVQSPSRSTARYYIGAARPVDIDAYGEQSQVPGIPGDVIARREECDESHMSHVQGENPWYVIVRFDWRGPVVRVPWPRRRVNWFGIPSDDDPSRGFDFLLLRASHLDQVAHQDGSLLGDVAIESAKEFAREVDELLERIGKGAKEVAGAAGDAAKSGLMWVGIGLFTLGMVYAVRKSR